MSPTTYAEWVADGSPEHDAPAIAAFAALIRSHGYTVYTMGDQRHLLADPPEDHTPFSHTAWPDPQPYPCVMAMDIMPGGPIDWQQLGEWIVEDKHDNKPGTEWIKYINYTNRAGECLHVTWEPTFQLRPSDDRGHIHISARSDLYTQTDLKGWDPVAELLGAPTSSTPAPAGDNPTEDIVNQLPLLQRGATGQAVGNLQALLNAHGANPQLAVDHDFGPLTDSATRSFQAGHHVANSVRQDGSGDGQVGTHTWAALLDVA